MLESMQKHFFEALRQERPDPMLGASNILPEQSWAIYRRNYRDGHVAALADTYNTVRDLVGIDYFNQLARRYVTNSESRSGDLNDYGIDFPEFLDANLSKLPGGTTLPYLPDIARLDWCWFSQLRSSSSVSDWLAELLNLPQNGWQEVVIVPAAQLLRSEFPIHEIWHLSQGVVETVNLNKRGETVLIARASAVTVTLLNEAQAAFVERWFAGEPLSFALAAALDIDDEFDFLAVMTMLAAQDAVQAIKGYTR